MCRVKGNRSTPLDYRESVSKGERDGWRGMRGGDSANKRGKGREKMEQKMERRWERRWEREREQKKRIQRRRHKEGREGR